MKDSLVVVLVLVVAVLVAESEEVFDSFLKHL